MHIDYRSLFQIRPANYDDIPSIMNIIGEAFKKYKEMANIEYVDALHETYEDVKKDIDTKLVLIALSNDEPVGTVRVEIRPDRTAVLTRFAVKVSNQNAGIGKQIMNLVDSIMIRKNVKNIHLYTGSKVTPLIRFYYGRGFYIESTDTSRGYVRAKLVKDYE